MPHLLFMLWFLLVVETRSMQPSFGKAMSAYAEKRLAVTGLVMSCEKPQHCSAQGV
jgi:hypothetical protein